MDSGWMGGRMNCYLKDNKWLTVKRWIDRWMGPAHQDELRIQAMEHDYLVSLSHKSLLSCAQGQVTQPFWASPDSCNRTETAAPPPGASISMYRDADLYMAVEVSTIQ